MADGEAERGAEVTEVEGGGGGEPALASEVPVAASETEVGRSGPFEGADPVSSGPSGLAPAGRCWFGFGGIFGGAD
jgi:hypothetical protein